MKQFFGVLFGGLLTIGVVIGTVYIGSAALGYARPIVSRMHLSSFAAMADAVISPTDGTTISGITRSIRWNANEEEDVTDVLPHAAKDITATAYIVRDLSDSTAPTISKNADQLLPIASLTKLVTAVVAHKLIPGSAHISLTQSIMATYGNTAGFHIGETFTADDLLYPLLMVSSNDAAEAYAQWYGRPKFIQAMNDFTQSIGAYRTYFADPSGLSPQNVSTANDLAIILDWIRKNEPDIISTTELKSKTVRNHTWVNPTHFLSWSNYAGGKNGYIPEANRTGASLFTVGKNKDLYAVVVLGSASRDTDEFSLLSKLNKN